MMRQHPLIPGRCRGINPAGFVARVLDTNAAHWYSMTTARSPFMDDEKLLEQLKRLGVWSGHRDMTMEDLARIQPGLGRIMPEVGDRTWKLYYAAQAENWPLAAFQAKEIKGLMELGAFTRPKHEEALSRFLENNWKPVQRAIDEKDFPAFEGAFHKAVKAANAYHELKDKPYLVWKLPESPPPDLDLRPRRKS
jgi:hypothetical protein